MEGISLDGRWRLRFGPEGPDGPRTPDQLARTDWPEIDAEVPGNVEQALESAGLIADPTIGDRVWGLRKYETFQWWYRRSFAAAPLDGRRAELVFEGLDCLGTVWLNGHLLGGTDNMLIAHRFDVTDELREGDNELVVAIASAVLEGRRHEPAPYQSAGRLQWESLAVRKAPHMYGWDIMPRLISAGLWRAVRLELPGPTRWRSVYWTTVSADADRRTARLLVDWDFATDRLDVDDLRVRLTLRRGERVVHRGEHAVLGTHGRTVLGLADVDLWWPRGCGRPALHEASVELLDADGTVLDRWAGRVGLRTIRLVRTDITTDEEPGEFAFEVNGHKVFVKGTNWVPLDALHSRDRLHVGAAVEMLADLNCNMVRCWGGNVYEDHAFFDLCDERGVMVWQDFAMACAIYPQSDEFAARIRREAEAVVTKLRNHACLALWAGNNEIDDAFQWAGIPADPNTDRLSRQVLPGVVRLLDPHRPYLPSSPYRSPELVRRGNHEHLKPEVHLWGPRGDFKGDFYTRCPAHFVSEIGYHGCPDRRSLERMMEAGAVWPREGNRQWLAKAVVSHPAEPSWGGRIELMARQIGVLFGRTPETLDDFVLASQITQAEALKFWVDLWRAGKGHKTGILWWNLRDGWPIISDAIVDYYNRRKLAYEYLKRAQADVYVICGEPEAGRHALTVVNDTLGAVAGRTKVRNADDGRTLLEVDFAVGPNAKALAGRLPAVTRPAMWLIDWELDEGTTGRSHYLAGDRPFELAAYRRWLAALDIPPDVGPRR